MLTASRSSFRPRAVQFLRKRSSNGSRVKRLSIPHLLSATTVAAHGDLIGEDLNSVEREFTKANQQHCYTSLTESGLDTMKNTALLQRCTQSLEISHSFDPSQTETGQTIAKMVQSVRHPNEEEMDELNDAFQEGIAVRKAALSAEIHLRAPVDAVTGHTWDDTARNNLLHFMKNRPVNFLIREQRSIVAGLEDADGFLIVIPEENRTVVPTGEARRLASAHNLDLMRVDAIGSSPDDRIAICYCVNYAEAAVSQLEFDSTSDHRASSSPTRGHKELLEVGFKGATHLFAIRVKAKYIGRFLLHRHPVRIVLSEYGTAREGFPVFSTILQEIGRASFKTVPYVCSTIRTDVTKTQIHCILYPSTPRLPLSRKHTPSPEALNQSMHEAIAQEQVDRHVDLPSSLPAKGRDRLRYEKALATGTAWTWRHSGLSLKQQRAFKIYQGWIPKGNKSLYTARGDVNLKPPFHSRLATSHEAISFPRESNLEQSERAAKVLGRRFDLSVSESWDLGETEGETHRISDASFMNQGDALTIGNLKEELGIKTNREKVPKWAHGFATLGVEEPTGDEYDIRRD